MLKHFWTRKVVISESEIMKKEPVSFFAKIRDFCSWNVNAILNQKQVMQWYYWTSNGLTKLDRTKVRAHASLLLEEQDFQDDTAELFFHQRAFISEQCRENNRFSFIWEKNKIISQDIKILLQEIENQGEVITSTVQMMSYYISKWHLEIAIIKDAVMKHFQQKILDLYRFIQSPIRIKMQNGKMVKISEYNDVNRDLNDEQRAMLAYGMKQWFLNSTEIARMARALYFSWMDLENFYSQSYDENIFNIYLQSIIETGKKPL